MKITIQAPILKGKIALPVSKSLLQRHWMVRAMHNLPADYSAGGAVEDLRILAEILKNPDQAVWNCGDSGACARFLLAWATSRDTPVRITGSARLCQRPVRPLVEALKQMGARIRYLGEGGFLPVEVEPGTLSGGRVVLNGQESSQYVSALMMLGNRLPQGLEIECPGGFASWPYIRLTAAVMQYYHLTVELPESPEEELVVIVHPGIAVGEGPVPVEGDWSAAAFWYEAVALSEEADLVLTNLHPFSVQGDAVTPDIFDVLGVHTQFAEEGVRIRKAGPPEVDSLDFDFTDHPDLFPALTATLAALGLEGEYTGIERLKYKESNRPEAMLHELGKVGLAWEKSSPDSLRIFSKGLRSASLPLTFDSHDDHRVAMALAPLALRLGQVMVLGEDVVRKSYPEYWHHMVQCLPFGHLEFNAPA